MRCLHYYCNRLRIYQALNVHKLYSWKKWNPFHKDCLEQIHLMHFAFFMRFHKHYTISSINTYMFKLIDISAYKNQQTRIQKDWSCISTILSPRQGQWQKIKLPLLNDYKRFIWSYKKSMPGLVMTSHRWWKILKTLTRKKQSIETPNPQTETTPLKGTSGDTSYL